MFRHKRQTLLSCLSKVLLCLLGIILSLKISACAVLKLLISDIIHACSSSLKFTDDDLGLTNLHHLKVCENISTLVPHIVKYSPVLSHFGAQGTSSPLFLQPVTAAHFAD